MKKFDLEEAMKNGIYSYVFGSKMLEFPIPYLPLPLPWGVTVSVGEN